MDLHDRLRIHERGEAVDAGLGGREFGLVAARLVWHRDQAQFRRLVLGSILFARKDQRARRGGLLQRREGLGVELPGDRDLLPDEIFRTIRPDLRAGGRSQLAVERKVLEDLVPDFRIVFFADLAAPSVGFIEPEIHDGPLAIRLLRNDGHRLASGRMFGIGIHQENPGGWTRARDSGSPPHAGKGIPDLPVFEVPLGEAQEGRVFARGGELERDRLAAALRDLLLREARVQDHRDERENLGYSCVTN